MNGPLADTAAQIAGGQRTSTQVCQKALSAAETSQPSLNAFTSIDAELALERASEIDRRVAAGEPPSPLTGVPIALKDLIDHRGRTTTCGSEFYRHQPDRSATVVDRLEAAGAVVIGRTGLHEFAYGFSSENDWFGPVRNPYDTSLSPGGSSGGSAAAVGGGIVAGAIGTDTGGSVRVPAALCGSVGLKVTHGRVPLTGVFPLAASLDTVGPITTSVGDARAMYEVMAGLDPDDPWSIEPGIASEPFSGLDGLKIGIPAEWVEGAPVSERTRRDFAHACAAIADAGAELEWISAPGLTPSPHLGRLAGAEAASVHREWFPQLEKRYGTEVEGRLANAMDVTLDEYVAARRWQAGLVAATRQAFESVDLLLTPSAGDPAKTIGVDEMDIGGKPTRYGTVLSCFSALVNHTWCPAITLPFDLPVTPPPSIQLIAPWWQEGLLLEVGEHLETIGLIVHPIPNPRNAGLAPRDSSPSHSS